MIRDYTKEAVTRLHLISKLLDTPDLEAEKTEADLMAVDRIIAGAVLAGSLDTKLVEEAQKVCSQNFLVNGILSKGEYTIQFLIAVFQKNRIILIIMIFLLLGIVGINMWRFTYFLIHMSLFCKGECGHKRHETVAYFSDVEPTYTLIKSEHKCHIYCLEKYEV